MIYELVANGKIVDTADNVHELNYSKIHHCTRWGINMVSDDIVNTIVDVLWPPAEKYTICYSNKTDIIHCHCDIIPFVKAVLATGERITIRPYGVKL